MPAYSFKEKFVPMVLDGSKSQTIRKRRDKGCARVGDPLFLFYGMRTKNCTRLRAETCVQVHTIIITDKDIYTFKRRLTDQECDMTLAELKKYNAPGALRPDAKLLTQLQRDILAYNDGFRPEGCSIENFKGCYDLMMEFWKSGHDLPFLGDVIHWVPSKVVTELKTQSQKSKVAA